MDVIRKILYLKSLKILSPWGIEPTYNNILQFFVKLCFENVSNLSPLR